MNLKQVLDDSQGLCSRDLSRRVRLLIKKQIFPHLTVAPNLLPAACQLNPINDAFLDQEDNKTEIQKGDWKCSYCNKRFKSELYVDRHMHNKHADHLSNNGTTSCLGDLCHIFSCNSASSSTNRQNRAHNYRDGGSISVLNHFDSLRSCTVAEADASKFKCEVMMRKCFGGSYDNSALLNKFQSEICGPLVCENGLMKGSTIKESEKTEAVFVMWIFQALAAVIIIGIAFLYAVSVGVDIIPTFGGGQRNGPKRGKAKKND